MKSLAARGYPAITIRSRAGNEGRRKKQPSIMDF